jgi:hypothetical protein
MLPPEKPPSSASKKKGIWVGGVVPLGYRVEDKKLLVDPSEAETRLESKPVDLALPPL